MLYYLQGRSPHCNFLRISGYMRLLRKMSVNGLVENVSTSEQCKREHEGDGEEPSKKLCTDVDNAEARKGKRHKYAMLLGYNGSNYYGMQCNKDFRTIESELFKAFLQVGIMKEDEVGEPYTIRFQRAARTDKTVSAARQLVSFLMADGVCKPEDLNALLPSDIRVFSLIRATKRFDSKGHCAGRTYSYVLPTHIFSKLPLSSFLESDYRITPDITNKINEILKLFIGNHNFHNFTSKINALDPRAHRFIISFKCEEPFVRNKEFIIITVKGQSFVLHQIRKMIGAVIAVMLGLGTPDSINAAFLNERLKIPMAPGEGLFLETPHFDMYNKRYGNDGFHQMLTWEDVEEEILNFRQEKIINYIVDRELEQKCMINWVTESMTDESNFFKPHQKSDWNETPAKNTEDGDDDGDEINGSEEKKTC